MAPISLITTLLQEILADPAINRIHPEATEPAWDPPLIGVARGSDPLFSEFKEDIGPFYWTPSEIFSATFPDWQGTPEALSVIVWILPQTEATRQEQRQQTELPGRRWSSNRFYGEAINDLLRDRLADRLTAAGYPAIAPVRSPLWDLQRSERLGIASAWSERHAAYAAGLGTFGLCDSLITPKGKAVRIGSVVAQLDLPATPRPYASPHAYCLFHARGTCGACIRRCPAGAVSERGHDKEACHAYIRQVTAPFVRDHQLGFPVFSCGLCQTKVPCEFCIPESGGCNNGGNQAD